MNDTAPTVFVIDDEESVRKALGRLLRACGYNVAAFGSAREFLHQCQPANPGCLVLDVGMPEMSGVELHQILVARKSAWPTIFLTGQEDTPMSVKAKNQRSAGFFTKPIDCETLLGAVEKAIEQDRTTRLASHNGAPGSITSAMVPKTNSARRSGTCVRTK